MADVTFTIELTSNGEAVLKNVKGVAEQMGSGVQAAAQKAGSGMDTLGSKALSAARAIGNLVGIGTAAGFIALTKRILDNADAIGDLHDQTELSFKSLIGLQQLTAKYGTSVQEAATGVRFMLRSLVEAQDGTGAQADAMKKLGFNTRDMLRFMSDPDRFLDEFSKKLAALPTQAERLAVAQDLASRAGGRLAPVLIDLATNGMPKVSKETEDAYKSLSQFTDALAVAAVKSGDFLTVVVSKILSGLGLVQRSADIIRRDLESLQKFAPGDIGGIQRLQKELQGALDIEAQANQPKGIPNFTDTAAAKKLDTVTDALKKQLIALQAQKVALDQGAEAGLRYNLAQSALAELQTSKLPASVQALIDKIIAQADAIEKAKFQQQRLDESTKALDQDMAELVTGFAELGKSDIADQLAQDKLAMDAFAQSAGAAIDALDAEFAQQTAQREQFKKTITDLNDRQRDAEQLSKALGTQFDLTSALIDIQRQKVEALVKEYGALSPAVAAAVDQLKALEQKQSNEQFFKNLGDSITRGISETLTGIMRGEQTLTEGLKNMLRNVLLSVAEAVNEKFFIGPLKEIVSGFMSGLQEAFADSSVGAAKQIARDLGLQLGNALREIFSGLGGGGGGGGGFLGSLGGLLGGALDWLKRLFGFHQGGLVPSYHTGGLVSASALAAALAMSPAFQSLPRFHDGGDVIARLQPGEVVMSKPAVQSIGAGTLLDANRNRRLPGGMGGGGETRITLDFQGAQIIPRAPWVEAKDVVKVTVQNLKDKGAMYGGLIEYGPKK